MSFSHTVIIVLVVLLVLGVSALVLAYFLGRAPEASSTDANTNWKLTDGTGAPLTNAEIETKDLPNFHDEEPKPTNLKPAYRVSSGVDPSPELAQTAADQAAAQEALPVDDDEEEPRWHGEEVSRGQSLAFKLVAILVSVWLLVAAVTAIGGWMVDLDFTHEKMERPVPPSKPEVKSSASKKEKVKVRSQYRRDIRKYKRQKRKYERYLNNQEESSLPVWQIVLIGIPILLVVLWAFGYLLTHHRDRHLINIGPYYD